MAADALTSAGRRRLALDGLRGAATVAVILVHTGVYARAFAPEAAIRPWVARLEVAAPVFFVLSGFLLYRPFVVARRAGRLPRLPRYAWHRVLRILPGYYVALLFAVVTITVAGLDSPLGVLRILTLAQGYDHDTVAQGLPQAWTLTTEVAFYVFIPLWATLLLRSGRATRRGEIAMLAGLAALSIAWKLAYLSVGPDLVPALDPWLICLPAYLDTFALGMAAAVLSVGDDGSERALPGRPAVWWSAAAALFAFGALASGLDDVAPGGFTHGEFLTRHALNAALAICCLMPAASGRGRLAALLATRPLRALGERSYAMYLYHLTVLGLLGTWGLARLEDVVHPYLLWSAATLAGALVLAELSWRLVELPALRVRGASRASARRAAAVRAGPADEHGPAPASPPLDR